MTKIGTMGKAINCILDNTLHKKVLDHKNKMQSKSSKNVTLTNAVSDLLTRGLKK